MYIRTNLSTWFNMDMLPGLCETYQQETPVWGGVFNHEWGIGGTGIFLNNAALDILLKDARKPNFWNSETPDDVLISEILIQNDVPKISSFPQLNVWDPDRPDEWNLDRLRKHHYTRLRFMPTEKHSLITPPLFIDTRMPAKICVLLLLLGLSLFGRVSTRRLA